MASFKYKNMQQFVKQTIHPYVVNIVLLIKDAFKHISKLEADVADIYNKLNEANDKIETNKSEIDKLKTSTKSTTDGLEKRLKTVEDWKTGEATTKNTTELASLKSDLESEKKAQKATSDKLDKHMKNEVKYDGTTNNGYSITSNSNVYSTKDSTKEDATNVHKTKYKDLKGVYISALPPNQSDGVDGDVWEQYLTS